MKEFIIYSDLHKGHTYEMKLKIRFSKNVVLLGDNFDVKNILKKELSGLIEKRTRAMEMVKSAGGIYISGNHSLEKLGECCVVRNGILFLHGDTIEYGISGANKYRTWGSPGKSAFYKKIHGILRQRWLDECNSVNKRYLNRARNLAIKNSCHTVCMGHFHPRKIIDKDSGGIRIVIVPRGVTRIKL